jgi:hypothetical protein
MRGNVYKTVTKEYMPHALRKSQSLRQTVVFFTMYRHFHLGLNTMTDNAIPINHSVNISLY